MIETERVVMALKMGDAADAEGVCGNVTTDNNRQAAGTDHSARLQPRLHISCNSQRHYKRRPG